MALKPIGTIEIPASAGSSFDHGAFDAKTRRVFVAHTGRDTVEVINHDSGRHIATLSGFPEAAGVVADDGQVLVTNRGAASLAWLDAKSLETQAVFPTGAHPNGVAIVARQGLAIVASIGDDGRGAKLEVFSRDGLHRAVELPGRPRWCVTNAAADRVYVAIRDPSIVFGARLPDLTEFERWPLSARGAHGLDMDHRRGRIYVACDDATLVEVDAGTGAVTNKWPIAGAPDVTFFNPSTGRVHVAIGDPGVVQTIDPRTGTSEQIATGAGAHTTALAAPDRLYVFSPAHHGALALMDA
jgi:DNA-binding beta-propeller fold protein YncE